jgi:hypothetical protein
MQKRFKITILVLTASHVHVGLVVWYRVSENLMSLDRLRVVNKGFQKQIANCREVKTLERTDHKSPGSVHIIIPHSLVHTVLTTCKLCREENDSMFRPQAESGQKNCDWVIV